MLTVPPSVVLVSLLKGNGKYLVHRVNVLFKLFAVCGRCVQYALSSP